ncbi:MAG: acyl--CoA ligase [Deltaproteobacteria bacterium]|nr:acyl--CoA ligase [Deltaproteobacteria bacterium]
MDELVHHFLDHSAERFPDKKAVFHGEESATYAEIVQAANRLANLLKEEGLKKSDRVLMAMENSIASIISYYAIIKAGGVVVEVPDKSTQSEVSYFINDCKPRIGIFSKASARRLDGISIPMIITPAMEFANPNGRYIEWDKANQLPATDPAIEIKDNELVSIVYTSGSTGKPKGVMLSNRNISSNTSSIISYLGITSADRIMVVLPFYYVYGKSLLNPHFKVGGSLVINNRFAFPNVVVDEMQNKEVSGFAGVPSTFAILLNRSIFPKTRIPTLRYVTQAGGSMAPALTARLMEVLQGTDLYIMYGATEASPRLTYVPPGRLKDKLGSIGIPIPDVSISIKDEHGKELPPGVEGNICATGPNIMQGYWGDEQETGKVIKPWGLITGDIGYKDEEGYFYTTGRKKEMLKVGGERISPKEIEDVLIESKLVHETAVIGRPDDFLYEVPEAFIVPIDPKTFDLEDVKTYTKQRLSVHKHPKYWHIVKSMPKKSSGKIDKEALKK